MYMIHHIWPQKALFLPLIIFCRIQNALKQKSTVLYIRITFTSYHIAFGYQILRVVVTKYVNYQSETLCISSAPAKKFTHLTFRRLRVLHMPAKRTQHVLVSSMRVKLVEKIMSYLIQFINENIGYCFFSNGGNNSHFKHIISTLFIIPTELITSSD